MKKIIITVICVYIFIFNNLYAQNITVSYYAGYGTYRMGDMKDMLNETEKAFKSLGLDGRIINNFPGYFNQTIQAGYSIKEHHFGLEYGLMSTGGKVGYSDYSGSMNDEINAKANKLGLFYKYHFYNQKVGKNWLSFFATVSPGVIFSEMEMIEDIHILLPSMTGLNVDKNEKARFEATSFYVEPQLGISFRFLNYFSAQLSAGYDIGINRNLKGKSGIISDEWGNQFNVSGVELNSKMDWSGFRANAGITIFLPTKKIE